jgi:hypothetical protein
MTIQIQLPAAPRILPRCEIQGYEALSDEFSYWLEPSAIRVRSLPGWRGRCFVAVSAATKWVTSSSVTLLMATG